MSNEEVRRQVEFAVAVASSGGYENRRIIVDEVMNAIQPFLEARRERDALLVVLAELAPFLPMVDREFGHCLHCGAVGGETVAAQILRGMPHEEGCPWVAARRLLGDSDG